MLQMLTKRYVAVLLAVVLSALLFLFPPFAVAAPITDFHQKLNHSIASLEKLVGLNERTQAISVVE